MNRAADPLTPVMALAEIAIIIRQAELASDSELEQMDILGEIADVLRKTSSTALGDQDRRTILSALEDAADYRREYQDGDCTGCDNNGYDPARPEPDRLCDDHSNDEAVASMYDLLHAQMQGGEQ